MSYMFSKCPYIILRIEDLMNKGLRPRVNLICDLALHILRIEDLMNKGLRRSTSGCCLDSINI